MPAEHGLGLDEQDEERPIGRRAAGARDAAPQDEVLLAQEGVLGDEGGPTAHEVCDRAHHDALFGALRRGDQALLERVGEGASALGIAAEQARQQGGSSSRTGDDRATPTGTALPACSAATRHVKVTLDANGYSKRPTQANPDSADT